MWTTFATLYALAGLATAGLRIARDLRTANTDFYRGVAATLRTLRGALVTLVIVPLALAFFLVVWPAFLYDYIREIRRPPRRSDAMDFEARFRLCRPEDLVAKLTIEQAEGQGRVAGDRDMPARPFGHLNAGWRAFVDAAPAGAELWSFDRRGRDGEYGEGFAFVVGREVHSEFAARAGHRWDDA